MASKITLKNLEQQEFTIQHPDGVGAGTIKSTGITYKIDSVDDFISVPSVFDTVIVKDKDRGGVFNKIASTTANGGTIFDGNGCSWERQYSGAVNVKWFGAVGDYTTDDTDAFKNALLIAAGKILYISEGVYRITESIDIPENTSIKGEGNTKIATFPQRTGEKELLRPDYKDKISGSVLIFDGTANLSYSSIRTDRFASVSYCLRYEYYGGINISDIAIIQDMDVLDEFGSLTSSSTDNKSDYEVGLILQSTNTSLNNVTIFGYFDVAGLWIHNEDGDTPIDPDYNTITNCLISSGVAITGHDTTPAKEGSNTGNIFIGSGIYAYDHHTRADGNFDIPAIYIDGYIDGSIGKIRGHSFNGCNIRCYANNAIVLDHADDIQFSACIWEFSVLSGITGADTSGGFVGTANTGDLWVFGGAGTTQPKVTDFISQTSGNWIFAGGGHFDGFMVGTGASGVRLYGDNNDSVLQLTKDFSSVNSDWTIRRDDSVSDSLDIRYDGITKFKLDSTGNITEGRFKSRLSLGVSSYTINTGAITIADNVSYVKVSNGGVAGDLHTINGTFEEGDIIYIRPNTNTDVITVKDLTGNIRTSGSVDIILNGSQDKLELLYDGTTFITGNLWDAGL